MSCWFSICFLNGPVPASFPLFLSFLNCNLHISTLHSKYFIVDVGNQIADLWCRKRPLCLLRHNHDPVFYLFAILNWKTFFIDWKSRQADESGAVLHLQQWHRGDRELGRKREPDHPGHGLQQGQQIGQPAEAGEDGRVLVQWQPGGTVSILCW